MTMILGYVFSILFACLSLAFLVVTVTNFRGDQNPGAYATVGLCYTTMFAAFALVVAKLAGI